MCPISGGDWGNGASAGGWAFDLTSVRGSSNTNVGFRADSVAPRSRGWQGGTEGDAFRPAG